VKLDSLHVCLGVSILFHIVVFDLMVMLGPLYHIQTVRPKNEPVITIVLETEPQKIIEHPKLALLPLKPQKNEPLNTVEPIATTMATAVAKIAGIKPVDFATHSTPSTNTSSVGTLPQSRPVLAAAPVESFVAARPSYLNNPAPLYPTTARRRHQEGVVLISVRVTAQGRAENVEIKQSSGYPLLDEAALNAVRDWEFVPARIGATALPSEIEVPLHFKIAP